MSGMSGERRLSPRIRGYYPVRVRPAAVPHVLETLTKDLSLGGLRCLSAIAVPVGTELHIELVVSGHPEPITAMCRTAWFRAIPESEQFEVGMAFRDLPQQDQRRLSAYLSRLSELALSVPA